MKCLVTGAAGFIGSHLSDYLISQGHDVTGIDALLPGRSNLGRVNRAVRFSQADIRDETMTRRLKGIDWVFHTAAVSTTPWAVQAPVTCHDINVTGTLNLLEAARRQGVRRFVLSSSNIVYAPFTLYWATKKAAEHYAQVYSSLYGLSTISLRYSNVFGSLRQNEENCIMSMRASFQRDGYIWLTGDGSQSRDFTSVHDICRANVLAADVGDHAPLDICTGINHSMNEVASYFGCPVQYRPAREGDVPHIHQDPEMAKHVLGWEAEIPFSEGMKVYL